MKINNLAYGSTFDGRLVVADASLGKTRGLKPKPYVRLTLTDGQDQISGMLWDWNPENQLPAKGQVLNVRGTCTEYQGKRQLSDIYYSVAEDQSVIEFKPHYAEDPTSLLDAAMEIIQGFSNMALRDILTHIYITHSDKIMEATSAAGVHHVGVGGNLSHSLDVAYICQAVCKIFPVDLDEELCVAGALVHDLGKLDTYRVEGPVIDYCADGELFDHIVLGLDYLTEADVQFKFTYHETIKLLKHIICSHHGEKEFGCPTTPRFAEAYVVSYADGISATLDTLRQANYKAEQEGKEFTDKIFTCNNTRHLLQRAVHEMLRAYQG